MTTRDRMKADYLQWMYQLVCSDRYFKKVTYNQLFEYLFNVDFTYTVAMDENRASDGLNLRYRYGYENQLDSLLVARYLDDCPCSVLEMMVALVCRFEEQIMDNPELGNRTGKWFWNMVESLGLNDMDDDNFDISYVEGVVRRFLNRRYARDGAGGLFTIPQCQHDLRTAEIWYQAMWYLDSVL